MAKDMTRAQIEAWIDNLMERRRPPKPKAVVEKGEVVREAETHVSRDDPNYEGSDGGVVTVRIEDINRHNLALRRGRQWKVEVVDGPSSAVPADVDRAVELRRELTLRERKERLRQNPTGWGVGETIEETVRRQNGDDAA